MYRRATSKKRAADAQKEIDTGDKEETPGEEVEVMVGETTRKTRTENVNYQEMMRVILERFGRMEDNNKELKEELRDNSKKMEEKIEDNSKKMEENSKKMEEKIDDNSKKMEENMDCLLYTSRCV